MVEIVNVEARMYLMNPHEEFEDWK